MGVLIVREMVGTSQHSWSDAARQAVAIASKTVRNIRSVDVIQSTARVEGGEIVEYRVQLKFNFEYEEEAGRDNRAPSCTLARTGTSRSSSLVPRRPPIHSGASSSSRGPTPPSAAASPAWASRSR